MTALLDNGAASAVPAFNPATWLASWQAHGGTVLLTGERLWLGRAAPVDTKAAKALNALKASTGRPKRSTSARKIKLALERQRPEEGRSLLLHRNPHPRRQPLSSETAYF